LICNIPEHKNLEFYKSLLRLKLEDYQRLTKKSNGDEGKLDDGQE